MLDFLRGPIASTVLLMALTAALVVIGFYVIGKVRPGRTRQEPDASDWITNFREMHAKGELSDAEYRTIKAMLAERFQKELKDTGEHS